MTRRILIPCAGIFLIAVLIVGAKLWKYYEDYEHYSDYTMVNMSSLAQAIQQYEIRNKTLPQSLSELLQPFADKPPLMEKSQLEDPWGTPFSYKPLAGGRFEIRSAGQDKKHGTWDDYILKK